MIVMPETTPEIKFEAVRGFGAEVVLSGESFTDAKLALRRTGARDRAASSSTRSTIRSSSPVKARSAPNCCATASAARSRTSSCPSAVADSSRASPATSRRFGPT